MAQLYHLVTFTDHSGNIQLHPVKFITPCKVINKFSYVLFSFSSRLRILETLSKFKCKYFVYLLTLNLAVETNERFSGIHLSLNSILDLGYQYNQCLTGLSESKNRNWETGRWLPIVQTRNNSITWILIFDNSMKSCSKQLYLAKYCIKRFSFSLCRYCLSIQETVCCHTDSSCFTYNGVIKSIYISQSIPVRLKCVFIEIYFTVCKYLQI